MNSPHPLDILFLTNFSDFCFRSIPAIAQMADTLRVRLTIMHVYDPARCSQASADAQVHSFFPEADRYPACQRLAVPGPLMDAVRRHLETWPVNLIIAPASDPIGLPRVGERSLRARLIEECGIPVWTIGSRIRVSKLMLPVKNVACWLDFQVPDTSHLSFAMEYARKLKAKLHVLRALPAVHEGLLAEGTSDEKALHPSVASQEILKLCRNGSVRPEVHIATGQGRSAVARMLQACDADVAFLRCEESLLAKWLGVGARLGGGLPCPAIYIGRHLSIPAWNLEPGAAFRKPGLVRAVAGMRGRLAVTSAGDGYGAPSVSWLSELGLI